MCQNILILKVMYEWWTSHRYRQKTTAAKAVWERDSTKKQAERLDVPSYGKNSLHFCQNGLRLCESWIPSNAEAGEIEALTEYAIATNFTD